MTFGGLSWELEPRNIIRNCRDLLQSKSKKAVYVSQQAPMSCQIWFVCKGQLIHTREPSASPTPHLISVKALPPPPFAEETMLTIYDEEGANMEVRSLRCLENSTSTKNEFSNSTSTHLLIGDARENGSTLASSHESQDKVACSLSAMFLEGPKRLSSSELQDKLEHATTDAENSKQIAFEESIKRWRAEEDAKEALHKAEESENSCKEEVTRRKEMETILTTKSQEIEKMKSQRVQFIEELQMIKDQKAGLLDRISKAREAEKELEEKIIQAVNLLITFKERRDSLQDERDNARRQINTLAEFVYEDNSQLSHAEFYKPSFLEIMKATENFNQSLKIGEGRCGSVYKGILRHVRVAIKMLPSLGSLGDEDFEHAAEVLSRIRHPNIVTLIGVCPETRSLIYEYLENGSLEDHIASQATAPPLQWHTRIRIASEMCSALIFLHGSNPQIIHGDLKLTNILLDSNHVCKLSDLGIRRLSFSEDKVSPTSLYNNIEPEVSAYMDPELFESGKLSTFSDIYSFGVVLLRILTGRPALSIINDTKCALENGNFVTILDSSGGDWPIEHAKELAYLGLRCCEKNPMDRPNLVNEILTKLETMRNLVITDSSDESENHRRIPSYFVCPIFQEVMKDPYIAADGFTYEADAIKGWLNSGHKTSPMTNLKLDHCDLLPNHALSYAIQEWQQHS
uniref:U-box domain-containing protein 33-like isoform X2 n=1 Tax=Erigeron canadensis TaxID=72917 RepID=UPI001CB8D414|nr:U-box domain-containing protein 33-like isoform X2 [Erigeron canadensis]